MTMPVFSMEMFQKKKKKQRWTIRPILTEVFMPLWQLILIKPFLSRIERVFNVEILVSMNAIHSDGIDYIIMIKFPVEPEVSEGELLRYTMLTDILTSVFSSLKFLNEHEIEEFVGYLKRLSELYL